MSATATSAPVASRTSFPAAPQSRSSSAPTSSSAQQELLPTAPPSADSIDDFSSMSESASVITLPANSLQLLTPFAPTPSPSILPPTSDPLSQLSTTAARVIVSTGCFITAICLGILFLLWRKSKGQAEIVPYDHNPPEECPSVQVSRQVFEIYVSPLDSPSMKRSPFPERTRAKSKTLTYISYAHSSALDSPVYYEPPFSPGTTVSRNDWKPHDGSSAPLRLSTDTCMVLDPFMTQRESRPPLPTSTHGSGVD